MELTDLVLEVLQLQWPHPRVRRRAGRQDRPDQRALAGVGRHRASVGSVLPLSALPNTEMGLTRQSVQRTVDSLAEEGLIVFRRNQLHQRAKLVAVTAKGMEFIGRQCGCRNPGRQLAAGMATVRSLQGGLNGLRKLRAWLEGAEKPGDQP